MTARDQEEYRALRSTIRGRGTARVWIFVAGIAAWAAVLVATAALAAPPAGMLVPLLVLASTFEAVFALHIGVERIGRYIQVFYEEDGKEQRRSVLNTPEHSARGSSERERASEASGGGAPRAVENGASASGAGVGPRAIRKWETVAMAYGRPGGSVRTDALFSIPFALAAAMNIVPGVLVGPTREELIFLAGAHALFLLRIVVARAGAARQRAIDLERFQTMKREISGR